MKEKKRKTGTDLLLFDQRPGISVPSCAGCPAYTVHVLAHVDRYIVANHMGYVANVDASRYKIRTNKTEPGSESEKRKRCRDGWAHMCIFWLLNCSRIAFRSLIGRSLE